MIIESFERDADDQVIAVSGIHKRVLSWEFIIDNKPQVGDVLDFGAEEPTIVKQEDVKTEELFAPVEEIAPVDPIV